MNVRWRRSGVVVLSSLLLVTLATPASAQRAKQRADRSSTQGIENSAEEAHPDEIRGHDDRLLNPPIAPRGKEQLPQDFRAILEERERERMHPALEPLTIAGLDENGAAFRASTPSLARALIQPLEVDEDELYKRKLALYARDAQRFNRAPKTLAPSEPARAAQPTRAVNTTADDAPPEEGSFSWAFIALLSSVAALIAVRRRGL